jgi:hypothetical protein
MTSSIFCPFEFVARSALLSFRLYNGPTSFHPTMTAIMKCAGLVCLLLMQLGFEFTSSVRAVNAFFPALSTRQLQRFAVSEASRLWLDKQNPNGEEDEQQRELEAAMSGGVSDRNEEDDDYPSLYNAAPLFTGSIITLFTLFLTVYGIYAGLTGDDPMSGHPKLR